LIEKQVCQAQPFIKWAGGKGQLLATFREFYPQSLMTGRIKRYVEPFVGGGAVLFDILQSLPIEEAVIIDINRNLINTYKAVKDHIDCLIRLLEDIEHEYLAQDMETRKKTYYGIRKAFNLRKADTCQVDLEKASQFIFLNKTCFNGLYRVNKSGGFNVPFGDYKSPTICDAENLSAASMLLEKVEIVHGDFRKASTYADSQTFVYFDPPYRPLNETSSFTSYSKQDFTDDDQVALADFYRRLHNTGALLMLSNCRSVDESIRSCGRSKGKDPREIR
jgi:DNA adenine methylase